MNREREHEFEYVVRIKNYGFRHVAQKETEERLLQAIYRSFKDSATVLNSDRSVMKFDSLALDGEHPGHDKIIELVPEDSIWMDVERIDE